MFGLVYECSVCVGEYVWLGLSVCVWVYTCVCVHGWVYGVYRYRYVWVNVCVNAWACASMDTYGGVYVICADGCG